MGDDAADSNKLNHPYVIWWSKVQSGNLRFDGGQAGGAHGLGASIKYLYVELIKVSSFHFVTPSGAAARMVTIAAFNPPVSTQLACSRIGKAVSNASRSTATWAASAATLVSAAARSRIVTSGASLT